MDPKIYYEKRTTALLLADCFDPSLGIPCHSLSDLNQTVSSISFYQTPGRKYLDTVVAAFTAATNLSTAFLRPSTLLIVISATFINNSADSVRRQSFIRFTSAFTLVSDAGDAIPADGRHARVMSATL